MTRRLLLLAALAACGGSKPATSSHGENTPPPTNTCQDYQTATIDALTTALSTYDACQTDADCTTIGFGASCIDACSRAIAKNDVDAFNDAVKDVDASQCKAFTDAGCPKPFAPPCAPPSTPTCNAGHCQ